MVNKFSDFRASLRSYISHEKE